MVRLRLSRIQLNCCWLLSFVQMNLVRQGKLVQSFPLPMPSTIPVFTHKNMPAETLWLLDGTSMLFKAHYGKGATSLLAGNGVTEVGATRAMGVEFARFVTEVKPQYVAMAFDTSRETTFRRKLASYYKAQRPPHPEDLVMQTPLAKEMVKALGCKCYSMDGYEADDIMATLASWGRTKGLNVVIISEDKDMWQLVRDRVHVMSPRAPLSIIDPSASSTYSRSWGGAIAGELEVMQRYALKPSQLIDLVALMGDSADNIPGVRGIGLKGATKLLQHFGTVDNLFRRVEEVHQVEVRGAKRLQTILQTADAYEAATLSKILATLKDDVPLVGLDSLKSSSLEYKGALRRANSVLRTLGFSVPLRIIEESPRYSREERYS